MFSDFSVIRSKGRACLCFKGGCHFKVCFKPSAWVLSDKVRHGWSNMVDSATAGVVVDSFVLSFVHVVAKTKLSYKKALQLHGR